MALNSNFFFALVGFRTLPIPYMSCIYDLSYLFLIQQFSPELILSCSACFF